MLVNKLCARSRVVQEVPCTLGAARNTAPGSAPRVNSVLVRFLVCSLVSQNVLRTYADTAKKFLLLLIHLGQICPPVSPPSFLPPGAFPPASGHLRRQQASGNTVPRNPPGRGTASLDAGVQEERRDEEPLAESDPTSGEFYRILLQYVLRRYGVDEKLADTSTDKAVAGPLLLLYPGDDPQH